jgi:RNA polymerase sigma factor (sigma-70 family)
LGACYSPVARHRRLMNNRVLEFAAGQSRHLRAHRPFGDPGALRHSSAMAAKGPSQRLHLVTKRDAAGSVTSQSVSDLEQLFVENLDVIEGVIGFVCHRHRVNADETDEFAAEVKLRLIDHEYEILRRFQQRSSLRTYLTVVIQRLFLDYRDRQWGKWRPSAEARRLGPVATRLEMLVVRDGMGFDQACEALRTNESVALTRAELEAIAERLPIRARRMRVDEGALDSLPHPGAAPDTYVPPAATDDAGRRIRRAVTQALTALGGQDRLILRLKFQEGLGVADIARALHVEQKPLYRRLDMLLRGLKEALESVGISSEDAKNVMDRGDLDLSVALSAPAAAVPASLVEPPGA